MEPPAQVFIELDGSEVAVLRQLTY